MQQPLSHSKAATQAAIPSSFCLAGSHTCTQTHTPSALYFSPCNIFFPLSSEYQHAEKKPSVIPCCSALELPGCPMVVIGHPQTHRHTRIFKNSCTHTYPQAQMHIRTHLASEVCVGYGSILHFSLSLSL